MTNGHTFYLPISEIDKPEYAHLKDGRLVLCLADYGTPIIARWIRFGPANTPKEGFSQDATHFSTHDPRPIGEHVVVECGAVMNKESDPNMEIIGIEGKSAEEFWREDYYYEGPLYAIVTVRIPARDPLKLEVTAG